MQSGCRPPTIRQQPISTGPRNFQVVLSDMIKPEDRASLLAILAEFRTAAHVKQQAISKGLTVEVLDPRGRVAVVKWRGIEIALLFQRQISQITIQPVETSPQVVIHSPEEAWVSLNLLGIRYDQELSSLKDRVKESEDTNQRTSNLLRSLQVETSQKTNVIDQLLTQVETLTEEVIPFRVALKHKQLPDGSRIFIKTKIQTEQVTVERPAKPGKYSQAVKTKLYTIGHQIQSTKGLAKKLLIAQQAVLKEIEARAQVTVKKKPVKKSKKKGVKKRP